MTTEYTHELTLSDLFNRLIKYSDNNEYIHTDNDGDYRIDVVGHTIFIYFEQSDSWTDWVSNFNFPMVTYKHGKETWHAHRGFLRVWKSMRDKVEADVAEIIQSQLITEIICVGYSHGAAICGLCVEDMEYVFGERYDIHIHGYGIGGPRFTWGKLPKEVNDRLKSFYIIRNENDLITHVPPKIFGYGYGPNEVIKIKPTKKYGLIDSHRPESYREELKHFDYKIKRTK
jgi:hypothetical protein